MSFAAETRQPAVVTIDPEYKYRKEWLSTVSNGQSQSANCPFCDVSSVVERSSAGYARLSPWNRPESFLTYQSTSNREVSLLFRYLVQDLSRERFFPSPSDGGAVAGLDDRGEAIIAQVVHPAMWLDALKYPFEFEEGRYFAPPTVYLQIGALLNMRCVVTGCVIEWKGPWYYTSVDTKDALPMQADVRMSFMSVGATMTGPRFATVDGRSGVGALPLPDNPATVSPAPVPPPFTGLGPDPIFPWSTPPPQPVGIA